LNPLLPTGLTGVLAVWRRNIKVWRRLIGPSLLVNFGEPLLYLLGLGYGLGRFIESMNGMPYLSFLAAGIVAASAMTAASFEANYSVYTRMVPQRTYDAMMATPLSVPDILAGELVWCATKSLINGSAILLVAVSLGIASSWLSLWVIPATFFIGLCFAGPALIMTAYASSYDFFNYYQTLILMPMTMLSGVFFPVDGLPFVLQQLIQLLPLIHAVELVRPLMAGQWPADLVLHCTVLCIYTVFGYVVAVRLIRKRLVV